MEVEIKRALMEDVPALVELVVRLKRLNSEFDPLYASNEKILKEAEEIIKNAVDSDTSILLKAIKNDVIIGVLKADIQARPCYNPTQRGIIREFYIMPEYRGEKTGIKMINELIKILKSKGVELIVAEFPSKNKLATEFYERLGYRPITSQYGKRI